MRLLLKRWVMGVVLAGSLGLGGLVLASDALVLKAMARAANEGKGCTAIPYVTLETECHKYQIEKNNVCGNFTSEHREVQKMLNELEEDKRKLEQAKSRNYKDSIPALEKSIEQLRANMKRIKAKAASKIQGCNECIAARKRVQRVFGDAKTMLKGETDPELKPYAERLIQYYETEANAHQTPIVQVENAKKNWEWVKDVTIP